MVLLTVAAFVANLTIFGLTLYLTSKFGFSWYLLFIVFLTCIGFYACAKQVQSML